METKGMVIIGTSLLIIVLIFSSYRTPNIVEEVEEHTINPQIENVLLSELIEAECERVGVNIEIVYAIINSSYPKDNIPRYGLMKIHGDLIEKYNVNWADGKGVVESHKANVIVGIGRLKWCMENNKSVEGALMVYIYTKPQAQEMWGQGIKTTEWVENVKEGMQ